MDHLISVHVAGVFAHDEGREIKKLKGEGRRRGVSGCQLA